MKTTISLLVVSLISAASFAADTKTTTTTTTTDMATSPSSTCMKLVETAKANKYEDFNALTTNYMGSPMAKGKMAEQRFDKMHVKFMDKIKGISCGTEHIAGANAFVEAETDGTKRFIPFVKVQDAWKFDAKTYMSFYGFSEMGPKGPMNKQKMNY